MSIPKRFTPNLLRQLELLSLSSRRRFLGKRQGRHRSLRRGHGMEFADYREYQPGDSLRHIDWGLYGRSDRLHLKVFQEEQNLSAMFILDCSNSMSSPEWNEKWQLAKDLIFALSYIALLSQEEVTICGLGSKTEMNLVGGKAVHRIGNLLDTLETGDSERFGRDLLLAVSALQHPGVAVLVTDLLMDAPRIRKLCDALCQKNLEVTVVHLAGLKDIDPLGDESYARVVDSESGQEMEVSLDTAGKEAYRNEYARHIADLKEYFHKRSISYALLEEGEELYAFLTESLGNLGLVQ